MVYLKRLNDEKIGHRSLIDVLEMSNRGREACGYFAVSSAASALV